MASANFKLTLGSTDLTTDALNLSTSKDLASCTSGGVLRIVLDTTAHSSATELVSATKYTEGAYVWIHNPATPVSSGNDRIYVSVDETSATPIILKGGDWALIPWAGTTRTTDKNILAWGASAGLIVEFGIYQ
tara:strand:+ start:1418 stop:1816 length:399 start_codon:yes stop_codon:yes gene_type:complete